MDKIKDWVEKYGHDFATTSGQWNGSGIDITFTFWDTATGYYLTVDLTDEWYARDFCRDNGYSEDGIDETIAWCEEFGAVNLGRFTEIAVDEANNYVKSNLDDGQGFEFDELLGVVGY